MKIVLGVLIFMSSLFSKEVCITNFNTKLCKDFDILNSVIVKSSLSKKELKDKLNKPLKQIAFLDNTNLFLVSSKLPLIYSKELSNKDFILYAQPNISQTKDINFKPTQNITKKYNLDSIWKTTKGEGVNIAIIDDGFNLEHEDLKGQIS